MDKKQRKRAELTLKNLLYYIDDQNKQKEVIALLDDCESKMNDSKLKNRIDDIIRKFKENDYFDLVDFLVDDILSSKMGLKEKKAYNDLLEGLKKLLDDGYKSFKDKFFDLFSWS